MVREGKFKNGSRAFVGAVCHDAEHSDVIGLIADEL